MAKRRMVRGAGRGGGVVGFLPGALLFFLAFLRRKAQQSWD